MKRRTFLKLFTGIGILVILIKILTVVIIEPWLSGKIQATLNENIKDYTAETGKVNILMIRSGIEMEGILLKSKKLSGINPDLKVEIASLKITGIDICKAIFKKNIDINEVNFSHISIKGKLPLSGKSKHPVISPLNIRIKRIIFDKTDIGVKDYSTSLSYLVKGGVLRLYHLQFAKKDTLSGDIVKQIDFETEEFVSVSADSMYSYTGSGIIYSAGSSSFHADSFYIHPNYSNYDFSSRHKYQTDRIEAGFRNIFFQDFDAVSYFSTGNMTCSYIEIGEMELQDFRDNRKEFRHINKPAFQELIYDYPGTLKIDSFRIINGNITYTEHAPKANDAGSLSFNEVHAKIYKITNDTLYKTEKANIKLVADALLMGKGKLRIILKGRLFDRSNTFSLNGTLSEMEAGEMNPFLENNAFLYVTSGKIDGMEFSFTANNSNANGKLTMLYHGLDITVKNKQTDDTIAFKERFFSFILNRKVLNSNPIKDEEVRVGVIEHERDPERSLFNYCAKAILSGIKSSLLKSPDKKKKK